MSFKAAAWAIEQSITTSPSQKLVLIALADCHNSQTGRCDPSIMRLAQVCHMSERTVIRHLSQLEELGLIERKRRFDEHGHQRTNAYKLGVTNCHSADDPGDSGDTPRGDKRDITRVTPVSLKPGSNNQEINQEGAFFELPEELRGLSRSGKAQKAQRRGR